MLFLVYVSHEFSDISNSYTAIEQPSLFHLSTSSVFYVRLLKKQILQPSRKVFCISVVVPPRCC